MMPSGIMESCFAELSMRGGAASSIPRCNADG